MFELAILKKRKYKNEVLIYEYSSIYNLMKELDRWLKENKIKEEDIYNIRRINDEN